MKHPHHYTADSAVISLSTVLVNIKYRVCVLITSQIHVNPLIPGKYLPLLNEQQAECCSSAFFYLFSINFCHFFLNDNQLQIRSGCQRPLVNHDANTDGSQALLIR